MYSIKYSIQELALKLAHIYWTQILKYSTLDTKKQKENYPVDPNRRQLVLFITRESGFIT